MYSSFQFRVSTAAGAAVPGNGKSGMTVWLRGRWLLAGLVITLLLACSQPDAPVALPNPEIEPTVPATLVNGSTPTSGATPKPQLPNFAAPLNPAAPTTPEPTVPPPTLTSAQPTTLPAVEPLGDARRFAAANLPAAPDRDLFQLAYQLLLPPGHPEVEQVVNSQPVSYSAGRIDQFYLVDLDNLEKYRATFELRLVSPHAYWYIEEGFRVSQEDIEKAAAEFEEIIYPRVTGYFGTEWTPGVDNDPRLTILHGDIRGAGGYYSSSDEYPVAIRPYSNHREMFYINISYIRFGSDTHLLVLAHELNHAVMWNFDPSEDTWVNEGLAELAVTVAGYPPDSISSFLRAPHIPLVHWPLDGRLVSAHYGGASLFMHYLNEHYPPADGVGLRRLMATPEDNIAGIDAYLKQAGYRQDFHAVLADWVAANFLDEDSGPLGYAAMEVLASPSRTISRSDRVERNIAQYATHYVELGTRLREGATDLRFEGPGNTRLLPAAVPASGCWWSNAGDSIAATLTREVDLTAVTQATLTYALWFSIEEEWDYTYLQVSENGGANWDILETPHTSSANPVGAAFGPGYTGHSRGWIEEAVDLSRYAGQRILVRFQYVTDDALNDIGLCLRELTIAAANVRPDDGGWTADGFVKTDNRVPQEFLVQVLQKGAANRVTRLPLTFSESGNWEGELTVEPYPGLERTVVAITAIAPVTRVETDYRLILEEEDN